MVTITVSGPGGNISYEMQLIQMILIAEGYDIVLEDEHPFIARDPISSSFSSWEEYRAHRQKLLEEKRLKGKPEEIKLVARHMPWGG